MDFSQQERKIEIASFMNKLLVLMGLPISAQTLQSQAKLHQARTVQDDVAKIIQKINSNQQTKQMIQQYFTMYLKRLIRQNQIQEALNVFQNHLPLYVHDLEPFTLLFAETHTTSNNQLANIFKNLLKNNVVMPEKRVGLANLGNEIWFLQCLGDNILAIDRYSNAKLLSKDVVVGSRDKLHANLVFCLSVKQQIFATGGDDTYCRIWNSKLEMIYEMSKFQNKITSICFTDKQIAVFDNGGIVHIIKQIPKVKVKKNKIACSRFKSITYSDVKYMHTNQCLLAAGMEQGKGRIDMVDLNRGKYSCKLTITIRIYNIELSNCQKLVFANLKNQEIYAYTTNKFELKYKFTGYTQKDCLMRMALGGRNHNILAVTSQEGCACLYDLNKQQLVSKLRSYSGKMVNCVKWIQNHLYIGCDDGYVQHWSNQCPQKISMMQEQPIQEIQLKQILVNGSSKRQDRNSSSTR